MIKTQLISTLLISLILAGASSCQRAPQWRTAEGAVWHTTYRISYQSAIPLEDSVTAVLNRVERSLSPFDPHSRISRINQNLTDTVDPLIKRVFDISVIVNDASDRRFDPTVAPLVNLWGFGYDRRARTRAEEYADSFLVTDAEIDSALTLVGLPECSLRGDILTKKHPATSFNFSAVTKGLACDEVAAMLRRNGCGHFMVEIGGEIALAGHNPRGSGWTIQIDAPVSEHAHTPLSVITPPDGGIATSGNYRNFHATPRYGQFGHTIDPVTGHPAISDIISATVIAPTCAEADAWATAAMASGSAIILPALREHALPYLLVTVSADTLVTISSPDFPQFP